MNRRVESCFRIVLAIIVIGSVCSLEITIVSNMSLTAVVNARVVLPCTPRDPGFVRWCFHHTTESGCDEVAISGRIVDDHGESYELQGDNLTVKLFSADTSGVYICVEANGHGVMHRINLTVAVSVYTNTTLADYSTVSESTSVHYGEYEEEDSTAVIIGVLVAGFVSASVVLLTTFAVLYFKCNVCRRQKRDPNTPSVKVPLLPRVDVLNEITKMFTDANMDRQTRDPWTRDQLHVSGYMTACAEWVVSCVNDLYTKPDAVIGIHGCSHTGSLLASRVAELLKLRLILIRVSDPPTHGSPAVANGETLLTPENQNLTAHLELRAERDDNIRRVVIVDTEMISGRSMKTAVELARDNGLDIVKCIVINDARSCKSRLPDVPSVQSLSHPDTLADPWHKYNEHAWTFNMR